MNWLRNLLARFADDAFVAGYRLGLEHGHEDERRKAERAERDQQYRRALTVYRSSNIISLAAHRSYVRKGAA